MLLEDATFSNVLLSLAQADNTVSADRWLVTSYWNVSPDAALQDAANAATAMFEDFQLETSMNNDLFNLISAEVPCCAKMSFWIANRGDI